MGIADSAWKKLGEVRELVNAAGDLGSDMIEFMISPNAYAARKGAEIGAHMNETEPCHCGHGKPMHCVSISQGGDGRFNVAAPCGMKCGCLGYRVP
jgi:hypothetical protein